MKKGEMKPSGKYPALYLDDENAPIIFYPDGSLDCYWGTKWHAEKAYGRSLLNAVAGEQRLQVWLDVEPLLYVGEIK